MTTRPAASYAPGLKPYPTGRGANRVRTVRPGQSGAASWETGMYTTVDWGGPE